MFKKVFIFPILFLLTLSSCGFHRHSEVKDADLIELSNDLTEELRDKAARPIPKNSLILVSTLLNVNNLYETSAFGRIISNQIASSFHNSGYRIVGMEMPIDLFMMKEGGALHLSDEIKTIIKSYNAAVIVGGVYAPGKRNTYVSLRIIDLYTKNIVSSVDDSVPMGPDARRLINSIKLDPAANDNSSANTPPTADESASSPSNNEKSADETVEEFQK